MFLLYSFIVSSFSSLLVLYFLPYLTPPISDPGCSNHPLRIERPSEGAYGYSVLRPAPQSSPQTPQCPEGCPMCYHSTKTPCQHCGCPSVRSGEPGVLGVSVRIGDQGATQRVLGGSLNLPVTKHRSALPTPDFFSPSSDYYSLSPSSPPPISSPATSSSPHPTTTSPQPIYAKVNKAKVSSPEKEFTKPSLKKEKQEKQEVREEGKASLPLYPERVKEKRGGESRRHSWASPRGPNTLPPTKHTSLQVTKGQQPTHQVSLLSQSSSSIRVPFIFINAMVN